MTVLTVVGKGKVDRGHAPYCDCCATKFVLMHSWWPAVCTDVWLFSRTN